MTHSSPFTLQVVGDQCHGLLYYLDFYSTPDKFAYSTAPSDLIHTSPSASALPPYERPSHIFRPGIQLFPEPLRPGKSPLKLSLKGELNFAKGSIQFDYELP